MVSVVEPLIRPDDKSGLIKEEDMLDKIQVVSVAVSVALILVILFLIKTRRLRIQYSLLWLITSVVLIVFSLWKDLLEKLAKMVGIYYPPSLLFLTGFLFSLFIILHFSVVVSQLSEMNKELAQRLSILTAKVKELEKGRKD